MIKSNVNKKGLLVVIESLKDGLGNGIGNPIEINLENVVIDIADEREVEYKLDNYDGKKGTYITELTLSEDEYAPLKEVKGKIDGVEYSLDELIGLPLYKDSVIELKYTDLVGNSNTKIIQINIDSTLPE